jgi:hypothetical protein
MLSIALLDVKRILRSKVTWIVVALALGILALTTVKEAYMSSAQINFSSLDVSGFQSFLPPVTPNADNNPMLDVRQVAPLLRLMISFQYLDYLALAAIVVFGGFFAQDIGSGYTALRRCRGLSPQRQFAANVITITMVSFIFSAAGIAFLYAVCLAVNPQGVNQMINGLLTLSAVYFLPQVAAAAPLVYIALFLVIYTGALTFLGLFGYFVARLTGNVLVASIAPAAFILAVGWLLAAHLPWPFRVFDYSNLSFAGISITGFNVALQYAGPYFVWLIVFLVLGFLGPTLITQLRKVRMRIW